MHIYGVATISRPLTYMGWLHNYMFTDISIRIYTSTFIFITYIYIYTNIFIFRYMCSDMSVRVYTSTFIFICTCVQIYIYVSIFRALRRTIYGYLDVCALGYLHLNICSLISVRMCISTFIFICISVQIHSYVSKFRALRRSLERRGVIVYVYMDI